MGAAVIVVTAAVSLAAGAVTEMINKMAHTTDNDLPVVSGTTSRVAVRSGQ